MRINGRYTKVFEGPVEVSDQELIYSLKGLLRKKYPKTFSKGEYIDKTGYWQIYDGQNHHNGNDEYKRGDKATKEDKKLFDHYNFIVKLLNPYD